ncbi:hypothetical protein pipiens_015800 [Culex pipiens pipiens]|uniref:Uncharacterized protein n=1 Tax=Culex pipiens pipiens TaxID=38569 RepID=A0ABD1CNW3_CULPP
MSKLFLIFCIVAVFASPTFQSDEEDTGDEPVAAEPEVHQDEAVEEEDAVADPDAAEIDITNIVIGPVVCPKGQRPDRQGICRSPAEF